MRFLRVLLLAGLTSTAIAAPYPKNGPDAGPGAGKAVAGKAVAGKAVAGKAAAGKAAAAATMAGTAAAGGAAADAAAAKEGEGAANKIDKTGVFDTAIALVGGDVQQDTLFTKSAIGSLEVEIANKDARTLAVSENKTPAAPPTGFKAIEPSSFKIDVIEGGSGLTLSKVDYVFDVTSPNLAGVDISKSQVGKLCTETNTFVIDPALGELEFEADEGEISLSTKSINGEWGIFIPDAAVSNAAVAANGTAVAEGKESEGGENNVNGNFDKAIATPGANQKTDILFTANEAGSLEVEVNATAANAVTVSAVQPTGKLPAGMLFVDPRAFQISTQSKTSTATDVVKVDYIFTPELLAAVDPTQGRVAKLDTTTNTYVVDNVGEFEFEADENEWSLTVPDLNAEWAILIPQAAVL